MSSKPLKKSTSDQDTNESDFQVRQERKLESLSLMAGGIAHDFNNLLLAIMGNADMLDQDLENSQEGRPLLDEIRKAAGRAADQCNQLLAYAGKGRFQFKPLDLSSTAREMIQMVKVAISRRITLRLDLADDLPLLEGDVTKIHQLIMNLIVNASEAIGHAEGVITLRTGTTSADSVKSNEFDLVLLGDCACGDKAVFLEVKDTGSGMTREDMEHIFDPFYSSKVNGRGLGLASVVGVIRGHQGALCVSSDVGQGSCFRVCFPINPTGSLTVQRLTTGAMASVNGGRVLVVDDEEYLRVLCARMLRRLGYEVLMASDGLQALEVYAEKKAAIDCIVLDLSMPGMDGVAVFEKLRDMDPDVCVILTSGYHEQEIATRFAGQGLAGFIQKPYVLADLEAELGRVIRTDKAD